MTRRDESALSCDEPYMYGPVADSRLSSPATNTGRLQRAVLRVLAEHEADGMLPTSTRFIFYELEQQGILSKITTGVRRADQNLSEAITTLRERGIVPWESISDETRSVSSYEGYRTVCEGALALVDHITLDPWGASGPPLIITESRSLRGVLEALVAEYRAVITSTNGQARGYLESRLVTDFRRASRVGYLGDWDKAGGQIEQNTRSVLERASGCVRPWERLAITEAQIVERALTPIVKNDQRYKDGGGQHEAWETEALSQRTIVTIVREWLESLLPHPLERVHVHVRERAERAVLRRHLENVLAKRRPSSRGGA